jgi:hypothetical protein
MPKPRKFRKSALLDEMRRAGYPREVVDEIDSQLPDPVDYYREQDLLARYGITLDNLVSRFGGSP